MYCRFFLGWGLLNGLNSEIEIKIYVRGLIKLPDRHVFLSLRR